MSIYDHIRCPVCSRAWEEHSPECSRHEFRPGAQVAPPEAAPAPEVTVDGELPTILRRLAAELNQAETTRRPVVPSNWTHPTATDIVASAAAEIDRLRAALARIEREAVVLDAGPTLGGREIWGWAIGRICGIPFTTRDEAVAAFREWFGPGEGKD